MMSHIDITTENVIKHKSAIKFSVINIYGNNKVTETPTLFIWQQLGCCASYAYNYDIRQAESRHPARAVPRRAEA